LAGEGGNGVSDAEFWVPACAAELIIEIANRSYLQSAFGGHR
jgi:hypothetical protein